MLAELITVSDSMKLVTKGIKSWNPRMKFLPGLVVNKVEGRKVSIGKDGFPAKCVPVIPDDWQRCRYYEQSNHNSFPMFNLNLDVQKFKHLNSPKAIKEFLSEEKEFLSEEKKEEKNIIRRIVRRITRLVDFVGIVSKSLDGKESPISEINSRINKADIDDFVLSMICMVVGSFQDDSKVKKIRVLLEIDKPGSIGTINKDVTYDLLNDAANNLDKNGDKNGTFAHVVIPGIGKYFPYSRNAQVECFKRYGMNSLDACVPAKQNEKEIVNMLNYVFSKEHKGKYWDSFVHKNGHSVFVVYADTKGLTKKEKDTVDNFNKKVNFVEWVGKDKGDELVKEKLRKANQKAREQMIANMKLIVRKKPDITVYVFAFFVPSNGPAKRLLFKNMAMKTMYDCVSEWQEIIDYYSPSFKRFISLARLWYITNIKWNRSAGLVGQKKYKNRKHMEFEFVKPVDIFNFIFDEDKRMLKKYIHILSQHHQNLLVDISQKRNIKEDLMVNGAGRREVYDDICLMAYCLKMVGYENIESNDFYKLGVLINQTERIQYNYHKSKNSGISLRGALGADSVRSVIKNPMRSISQMLKKNSVYMKWAKVKLESRNQNDGLSYAYYGFKKVIGSINIDKIKTKPTNEEILMLVLGYYDYHKSAKVK